MKTNNVLNDFSFSSITAGFVSDLVGYASSAVLIFQAATTLGLQPNEASSWLAVLCVAMGVLNIVLSLRYKIPIMFAWSTPGAALLIASLPGVPISDAIGAFLFSALLITLSGVTGFFEKIMDKIPMSIASAMLSGVLLKFGLEVFISMKSQFILVFTVFMIYLIFRRISPRYSVVAAFFTGLMLAGILGLLNFETMNPELAVPVFTAPTWNFKTIISVGLPLFIVTMSSQNMTGFAVLKAFHYRPDVSKLITWSGITNLIIAPFGGFAINLSAITAAICMGPEAHEDPNKRYTAAISSGVIYIIMGIFAGSVGALFAAFPKELVLSVAGLALLGAISQGLMAAVQNDNEREPAMMTFFVTASGVTLAGIGSAFWGITAGILTLIILRFKR
ncbi:benzoate/H(+) symporter BenE family transporter [Peredibacter sp. HCB2-198]|uniref:benzoate/H(+) symporter BenE family transporter n=1 Tax=Peredibacter sp. HCB2-198 TaxID=3383025 RepID=UPI0038B69021